MPVAAPVVWCCRGCPGKRGRFVSFAGPPRRLVAGWRAVLGWFACPACGRTWAAPVRLYRARGSPPALMRSTRPPHRE